MYKKVISILLVVSFFTCLVSCDSEETGVVIDEPIKVAVGTDDSSSVSAARDYASVNGYELVEYDFREGAIVSVENGVNDYVVLNSDNITDEYLSSVSLDYVEDTGYKIEYCAYFDKNNTDLQQCFNQTIEEMKTDGTLDSIDEARLKGKTYTPKANKNPKGSITILCTPIFENRLYYTDSGQLKGVEYDIIQELCSRLNVKADIVIYSDFTVMFSDLDKGKGDVVISSATYTQERASQFLCSDIYAQTTFGVYKVS